ncbi:beta-lactamase family protein [Mycoplasmatota bacterium]|nr:beta-lactamase family protein [Mycoplasmatota bacterium]
MKSKKLRFIIIFGLSLVISSFFIPWELALMRITPAADTIQMEIDRAVDKHDLDGVLVYVDDQSEQMTYAAGYDNRDEKTAMDGHKLFKIASISKLYMAVAAAKLIDDNQLDLNDTLSDMLPQYKDSIEYADEITLRMLIQHRSGIPNYIDDPDFPWDNLPTNVEDVLDLVLYEDANFKPDKKYQYSNTNYLLLAMIMDDVLGYAHATYIKENILDPLGLENTYYYYSEVDPSDVISGYTVGYAYDLKPNDHITPGGTMVATIKDVATFIRALNDGRVFDTNSEAEIYKGIYVYEHTGLLPGYESIARYDEENDRVVIVFINTSGGNSWGKIEIIYDKVEKILSK